MSLRNLAGLALAALLPFAAGAQSAPATPTVGDLERIQGQTILLKAEAAQASAAATLASKGGNAGAGGVSPVVSDVYGGRHGLFADFLYANGASVVAKAGDAIPGGYRVLSIALDHVRIERAGRVVDVGFSGTAPVPTKPPAPSTFPGVASPIIPAPFAPTGH